MKRTPLTRRTEIARGGPLPRASERGRQARTPRRAPLASATDRRDWSAPNAKVEAEGNCRVNACRNEADDPAHIAPRSLGGGDGQHATVPLCREHHRRFDQDLKRQRYLQNGVAELWIADAEAETVEVWRPGEPVRTVTGGAFEWRVGEESFHVSLAEIFRR